MSANIQTEAEFKPQEEQGVLQQMESPPGVRFGHREVTVGLHEEAEVIHRKTMASKMLSSTI